MTFGRAFYGHWPRSAMMALAILALVVKVLVPQGFMAPASGAGQGFALVICTAQGRITLDPPADHAPPAKSKADSPCAFAGNLTPTASPVRTLVCSSSWTLRPVLAVTRRDQAPGRGMPAPPPPSIGPPHLI